MALSQTENQEYQPYCSLPVAQFKITRTFDDPFWARPGWKPLKIIPRLLHRRAHQRFVGGSAGSGKSFQESCRFQIDFMKKRGLCRDDVLLDLGCGSLRGGIHFIRYLHPEKYLGMDISAEVVRRGITRELGREHFHCKKPEFVISDSFEFHAFSKRPRYAIANSVFTHLPPADIAKCLHAFREYIGDAEVELFATFHESDGLSKHNIAPHYLGGKGRMDYTRDEMHDLGRIADWHTEYIGVWEHPKSKKQKGTKRPQQMFRFASRRSTNGAHHSERLVA